MDANSDLAQTGTNKAILGHSVERFGTASGTDVAPRKRGRLSIADKSAELKASLPKGVRIGFYRDDRNKPYFVRFGSPRKIESFQLEIDRNDRATELASLLVTDGTAAINFDANTFREWKAFRSRCQAPLHELEALWLKHSTAKASMQTGNAVERYISLRLAEDIVKDSDTHRHLALHLKRFVCDYGATALDAVTADMIREWLGRLRNSRDSNKPMKGLTLRHHRKDVNTFFRRAVREGWCAKNPCEVVVPAKAEDKDHISFLSVEHAFRFFRANISEPVVVKLALEAFAGMRCSAVAQLVHGDLHFAEKGVHIPAGRKSKLRNYVDGFPENLWAWLELAKTDAPRWKTNQSTYDLHKGKAFLRAGVENTGNVLRHSFCTYHVGAFKDVGRTATLLCHAAPPMLYRHYKGRGVGQLMSQAYFAITPEAVAKTWEEFIAPFQTPKS